MSNEKIPSLKKSVSLTLCSIIGLPVIWWLFLDFPMNDMSDETGRKFSQIGAFINLIAGLSMVVRYLWLNNYKKRLEWVYQIDKLIVAKYEFIKHHIYDQDSKDEALKQFRKEQHPLYDELESYLKFDKVESIHMIIGIAGLCIGTFFQIVGAG